MNDDDGVVGDDDDRAMMPLARDGGGGGLRGRWRGDDAPATAPTPEPTPVPTVLLDGRTASRRAIVVLIVDVLPAPSRDHGLPIHITTLSRAKNGEIFTGGTSQHVT